MPRPAFKRLEIAQRAAILEKAGTMFADKGYDGTSYNRLIQEIGFSKGAMYHYFEDKDDLFQTTVNEVSSEFIATIAPQKELATFGDYWHEVGQICTRFLDFLNVEKKRNNLLWWIVRLPEGRESHQALKQGHDAIFGLLTSVVERGQEVGAVQTDMHPRVIAQVIFGVVDGLWKGYSVERDETSSRPRVGTMLELIRRVGAPRALIFSQDVPSLAGPS